MFALVVKEIRDEGAVGQIGRGANFDLFRFLPKAQTWLLLRQCALGIDTSIALCQHSPRCNSS
jgi:hypothetical protein